MFTSFAKSHEPIRILLTEWVLYRRVPEWVLGTYDPTASSGECVSVSVCVRMKVINCMCWQSVSSIIKWHRDSVILCAARKKKTIHIKLRWITQADDMCREEKFQTALRNCTHKSQSKKVQHSHQKQTYIYPCRLCLLLTLTYLSISMHQCTR